MKRIFFTVFALALVMVIVGCNVVSTPTAAQKNMKASDTTAQTATTNIPVPNLSYFPERQTIARWAEAWDKPDIPTYVYLISFGKVIGYYVCNGKPASTQSYLTPEQTFAHVDVGDSYGDVLIEAPDIDGTYGANNPGIRFFTASGIAVEWAGDGASYVYSNAILPLDVPLLGK